MSPGLVVEWRVDECPVLYLSEGHIIVDYDYKDLVTPFFIKDSDKPFSHVKSFINFKLQGGYV